MPRPNPPRKRPRKRPTPSQRAVRADATLTKQTAQSEQPRTQPAKPQRIGAAPARAAALAPGADDMWSRRSYAILVVILLVVELIVTGVQWALAGSGSTKPPLGEYLLFLNPISLLIAALIAAPIARILSGERRPLRPFETLTIGVVAYFMSTLTTFLAAALLGLSSSTSPATGSVPTPLPNATSSAQPAPTATPATAPSASASPSAKAGTSKPAVLTANDLLVFGIADVVALVATVYVYPPLYRRLRVRRPTTAASKKEGDKPREKSETDTGAAAGKKP